MGKNAKDKTPPVKPVIKAELSGKNKKWRIAAVILLLILGASLIAFSAVRLLGKGKGYTEIKAEDSVFSEFFKLHYDIGASGAAASAEYRKVRDVYSKALDKYAKLFSSDTDYSGIVNIRYINLHPNEEISVDPALFEALKKLETMGDGQHYLGITLEIYGAVFSSSGDGYAAAQDPKRDAAMGDINRMACEFSRDRDAVNIEFLADNKIRLNVCEEYMTFASEYGFTNYIDLGIFTSAFIVDATAEALTEEGLTYGSISSYDGFSRNLDTRDIDYSFSFYSKYGDTVYPVCDVSYKGSISSYAPKTYPTGKIDALDFYLYSDGVSAHKFIDTESGEYKSSLPDLLLASRDESCFSLAIRAYNALVRDSFDEELLTGISAAWLEGNTVRHMGDEVEISNPYSDEEVSFIIAKSK